MKKLLLKNIKQLVGLHPAETHILKGKEMDNLPVLNDAWLAVEDGVVVDYGEMSQFPGISDWTDLEVLDCEDRLVIPAYIDSHTHLVFASWREKEFEDRIHGLTYEQIAERGGGILNSAKKVQQATEDELFFSALQRADELIKLGTGAIEIKSGYGLSAEAEIKMLRVIQRLKKVLPIPVKATFLGAHALPAEYKQNREKYIQIMEQEMLPVIAKEQLADYIDVFCETNYFTPQETERIIQAGAALGLKPKIHVNQFTSIGGLEVAVKNGALSVDHLEVMTKQDFEILKQGNTIPVALPSCSFFLNIPYAPAKEMINQGLPVALASDFNPGSTPSGNLNFVFALA
ncbi:MAG: imidazolonepropionase, partial [Bacteroidetes bacterium]